MYASKNFKTKKALRDAIAAGEKIAVFQPNDIFGNPAGAPDFSGTVTLEGPHYPEPHRWYGTATLEEGIIVSVR